MKRKIAGFLAVLFLAAALQAHAQYVFVGGKEWVGITNSAMSDADKAQCKIMFLKTVYETNIFNASPLASKIENGDFSAYVAIVDKIYQSPADVNIPLCFALHIADMVRSGKSPVEIARYKILLMSKINKVK